jgi:hypothetical protein
MRVSGRALALGFLVGVCAPAAARAAPIAPTTCTVLQAASCTPTRIADPFSPATFDGAFATGDDLYLFLLHFDDDVQFTATTTSFVPGNFDPTLALYDGGGSILQLPDPSGPGTTIPARFFDIDLDGQIWDDRIDLTLGAGDYLLALVFGNAGDTLAGGFDCGSCDFGTRGTAFSLDVSATPLDGTDPIPEPGTLTLMAGGAIAGWLHRRRARTRGHAGSLLSR